MKLSLKTWSLLVTKIVMKDCVTVKGGVEEEKIDLQNAISCFSTVFKCQFTTLAKH